MLRELQIEPPPCPSTDLLGEREREWRGIILEFIDFPPFPSPILLSLFQWYEKDTDPNKGERNELREAYDAFSWVNMEERVWKEICM